jgi:pantetheine-phosphate adenylyltransferase
VKSIIVSGSFDPITYGHTWLVNRALQLADTVHLVVANNPSKKYMFDQVERFQLAYETFSATLARVEIRLLPAKTMLVDYAREFDCKHILRGLRTSADMEYERGLERVQAHVNNDVSTLYVLTPPELAEVSSSMVRGLVGLRGWELVASDYVPPPVLAALQRKAACSTNC